MKTISFIFFIHLLSLNIIIAQKTNPLSLYKSEIQKEKKRISIDETFSNDTTIYPFKKDKQLTSLAISGFVNLGSPKGHVRITLLTPDGNEYLVYESYFLLNNCTRFSFYEEFEETGALENVTPLSIKLRIIGGSIGISDLIYTEELGKKYDNLKNKNSELITYKRKAKIDSINKRINQLGLRWKAGETSISKLPYSKKKHILGEDNNWQGFEYYKGGTFEYLSESTSYTNLSVEESGNTVNEFDWRNRHGANRPYLYNGTPNPYYRNNSSASGWLTTTKDQGSAGTCWAHANVGAMEAQINLYFNQFVDPDLSEQMLVDCANSGEISELSDYYICGNHICFPGYVYCKITNVGIVEEDCDPYVQRDLKSGDENCCNNNYICSDWPDRTWKCDGFHDYKRGNDFGTPNCEYQTIDISIEEMKKVIINNGPVRSGIDSWNHAMVLCGFRDNENGQTEWLYKNSWGEDWGDNGYGYVILSGDDLENQAASLPKFPFYPPTGVTYSVNCLDADGDGIYNWGTGSKPATCPSSSPNVEDGDDSNPLFGPMTESGDLMPIIPITCQDMNIATNTTWTSSTQLCGNITVDGCVLTIAANIALPNAAIINVINGGELIIDGGHLHCGNVKVHNGCNLLIKNNGSIKMDYNDNIDLELGATSNIILGTIE